MIEIEGNMIVMDNKDRRKKEKSERQGLKDRDISPKSIPIITYSSMVPFVIKSTLSWFSLL